MKIYLVIKVKKIYQSRSSGQLQGEKYINPITFTGEDAVVFFLESSEDAVVENEKEGGVCPLEKKSPFVNFSSPGPLNRNANAFQLFNFNGPTLRIETKYKQMREKKNTIK